MYAEVCANTGWTWDQVGRLTIRRFMAMRRQWERWPPVHQLVAAYLGVSADKEDNRAMRAADMDGPPPM